MGADRARRKQPYQHPFRHGETTRQQLWDLAHALHVSKNKAIQAAVEEAWKRLNS